MRSLAAVYAIFAILSFGRAAVDRSQEPNVPASAPRDVLRSSINPKALEQAAIALVESRNSQDLAFLGLILRDPKFLARLDNPANAKTGHLYQIMTAFARRPIAGTAELCHALAADPAFLADPDRISFLLEVLAAVKPMSERTAALFERTNGEGYFGFNARLLTVNGSPRALGLFESMMIDETIDIESRVECLHVSIVPRKIELPILRTADRILSRASEPALVAGVIESVFDFRQQWFGIESGISKPPPWLSASVESRQFALRLAERTLRRSDLDSVLRKKVGQAREAILRTLQRAGDRD